MKPHCTFSPMYEPAHLPIHTLFNILLRKSLSFVVIILHRYFFYCTSLVTVFACIDTVTNRCSFYRSVTFSPKFPFFFFRSLVTEYDLLLSLCLCTVDVDLN